MFAVLTWIWLPLVLRRHDPDEEFLYGHATGAAVYQGLTLGLLLACWGALKLPGLFLEPASASLLLAMLGVVAMCTLILAFFGALGLALQAWNGDPFWAPLISWLLS